MATVTWVGSTGFWNAGSHWSTGTVPGPSDDVTISGSPRFEVYVNTPINVASLTTSYPAQLLIYNTGSNTVAGNLVNGGLLYIDAQSGEGGASLTVGTLSNTHFMQVGNPSLSAGVTITAGSFVDNPTTLDLFGNGAAQALIDIAEAAPSSWAGLVSLNSNAALEFGGGGIETIGSLGIVVLDGSQAQVDILGEAGANSGFDGLADVAGELIMQKGAELTTGVGLSLSGQGSVAVDDGYAGGSILTVDGTLDLSAETLLLAGNNGMTLSSTVSASGLLNSSSIYVTGNYSASGASENLLIDGSVVNDGMIRDRFGTVAVTGGVTGNGTVSLGGADAVVELGGSVGAAQLVEFTSVATHVGGTLELDDPDEFGGTISGMAVGVSSLTASDAIDLSNIAPTSVTGGSLVNDVLSVTTNAVGTLSFPLTGTFPADTFVDWLPDANGGTDIFLSSVPCFRSGTRIATGAAEVPVEELAIGDRVLTRSGELRPVKWIGRRSYSADAVASNPELQPIRVRAGALGDGLPRRDLFLSPHHALWFEDNEQAEGILVPVGHLVDDASVRRCAAAESVEYFHIELDSHDVILAEGAAAESFVDCDSRAMFDNAGEFAALYPAEAAPPWMFCAPRVQGGPALEAIRRRIEQRFFGLDPELRLRLGRAVAVEMAAAETAASLDPAIDLLLREAARLIARKQELTPPA